MKSTISDVAALAKVSRATVSRVLNDPTVVKEKTRKQVEDAIGRLNYHPNLLGRNLRQSKSGLIMVLMVRLNNPFYNIVIEGIQEVAQQHGYNVMLCQHLVEPKISAEYLKYLRQKTVDGLIVLDNTFNNSILEGFDYANYPIIQCSQYGENVPLPYVTVDDKNAMKTLVRYLLGTGRHRIALMNGDRRFIYAKNRLAGFEQALADAGIEADPALIKYVDVLDYQSAMVTAADLIERDNPPEAIIGVSDVFALAALKVGLRRGLKVPKDISIASFDNTELTVLAEPSITSISQPRYNLGVEACKMLFEKMENFNAPIRQVQLQAELIIRESTML